MEGYQSGLETGDIEWASYNCMHYCKNLFISGKELELVEKEQASYQSVIVKTIMNSRYTMHKFGCRQR
ncbi:hypothetical protein HC766_08980 [Candidatus Gracilibacteria bacterium]|nr:hypothetical protein [Candidatus Gracilibacteria bacterium]